MESKVSTLKLIRDMSADEIEVFEHEVRMGRKSYSIMQSVELYKIYKQLTGKNWVESPSPEAEKEYSSYLKTIK